MEQFEEDASTKKHEDTNHEDRPRDTKGAGGNTGSGPQGVDDGRDQRRQPDGHKKHGHEEHEDASRQQDSRPREAEGAGGDAGSGPQGVDDGRDQRRQPAGHKKHEDASQKEHGDTGYEKGRSMEDFTYSLRGMEFPTDKKALMEHARQHSANEVVMGRLDKIEDRVYDSITDVSNQVGKAA